MKKQLLLGFLPALLVLSACNGGGQVKEKYDDLLEDTLAHEEIFDQQEQGLAPRRLLGPNVNGLRFEDPTPVTEKEEVGTPYIGVQSIVSGNTVSFRFVAAVQFASADQRELATATWTRTVSKADGTAYPKDTSDPTPACTTAYKKLSNGGSALTIEDFNAAHNNSTYTHFVVYTLRNINLNTYAGNDYYVSAYLSIGGLGGDPLVSKAIAIRFDRNEKYVYEPFGGAYFMNASWSSDPIPATTVRQGGNKASFENLDLDSGDKFIIKEFYNTKLEAHYSSAVVFGDNITSYELNKDDENGRVGINYNGVYSVFLKYENDQNKLFVSASQVENEAYLRLDVNVYWWNNASDWTGIYVFNGENPNDHNGKWLSLNEPTWGTDFDTSTADVFFTHDTYEAGYNKVAVCRLKGGKDLPSDRTYYDSSIVDNVTVTNLITNGYENCVYVYLYNDNLSSSMGR